MLLDQVFSMDMFCVMYAVSLRYITDPACSAGNVGRRSFESLPQGLKSCDRFRVLETFEEAKHIPSRIMKPEDLSDWQNLGIQAD